LSGLTAIPIQTELEAVRTAFGADWPGDGRLPSWATEWFRELDAGISATASRAPFMFYGTDWLAFGQASPEPVEGSQLNAGARRTFAGVT
jgi:hypothetical protein